jgi:hypothetical protein
MSFTAETRRAQRFFVTVQVAETGDWKHLRLRRRCKCRVYNDQVGLRRLDASLPSCLTLSHRR